MDGFTGFNLGGAWSLGDCSGFVLIADERLVLLRGGMAGRFQWAENMSKGFRCMKSQKTRPLRYLESTKPEDKSNRDSDPTNDNGGVYSVALPRASRGVYISKSWVEETEKLTFSALMVFRSRIAMGRRRRGTERVASHDATRRNHFAPVWPRSVP